MVTAVEFLAKQALPFRGRRDDNVDFKFFCTTYRREDTIIFARSFQFTAF